MNKARKKFVLYAELSVLVLLTVLLTVINIVNFSMAADDADHITERIANNHGGFDFDRLPAEPENALQNDQIPSDIIQFGKHRGGFRDMGPNSPEMNSSMRYFTYSFDENGNAQKVVFKMSSYSEEEAKKWAESLINNASPTGWTNTTYRYRIFEDNEVKMVTVIDEGRELYTSYRILIISLVGGAVMLLLGLLFLHFLGKRLFKPLEESDRKQKQFISGIESSFKMPLTIISANTEYIERQNGPTSQTDIINNQVRKMNSLVKDLGSLTIFDEQEKTETRMNLSDTLIRIIDTRREAFEERKIQTELDIDPDIIIDADDQAIKKAFAEIADNSIEFSLTKAVFELKKNNDRIRICVKNDTDLPNGTYDQVFDRFTKLKNAENKEGRGLGLSYVKDVFHAHNARVSARVSDGSFIIRIDL